ncbi:GNAT family N-acetyltransferase [Hymenobacter sp. GOD-10R]|uniref:GNAT family N-acetyltransferase n=1 Tax=Hymenobacter sp. GOD-10R TaxID=3093922 RepID=UPI002D78DE56|nr:GNAT family N-acetyltransferase [Hymenobacter sp. GOD-10R]WRQ28606.1 GNAT family N-acetyltransferase [Hymenobacter sp. GOD-10R]
MSAIPQYPVLWGDALDHYLGQGYYRMQQDLFTCQFLPVEGELYTVHWLRLVLPQVQFGAEQRRLFRLNQPFVVSIRPFQLTEEYEALYAHYRASTNFDAPSTIESFLFDGAKQNIFTTSIIEVRDGARLIAGGIFDSGRRTLAGIMNFYDPAYRRHSLGKYLMLLKIEYALSQQLDYYYPGYLVHDYPKFDYKLFACREATEVFDCVNRYWLPFSWPEVARQSAELMAGWQNEEADSDDLASAGD